jgi:hypothetical protein
MADASARYKRKRQAEMSEEEKAIEREKTRLRVASLRQRRAAEAVAVPERRSERIAARQEVIYANVCVAADGEEVAGPSGLMQPVIDSSEADSAEDSGKL